LRSPKLGAPKESEKKQQEEEDRAMKVLVIGGGGREHAICWSLSKSARVTEVVCAPGNEGIAQIARCVSVNVGDLEAMLAVAEAEQPELIAAAVPWGGR
jgi:phosphoribosylamine-glycine ligase